MTLPHQQLRKLRRDAGYPSARAAARAMDVRVSTYIQHESGRRGFSIQQFESYEIFLQLAKLANHFLRTGQDLPDTYVLAALVYDGVNRAKIWTDAPELTQDLYLRAAEAVLRSVTAKPPEGLQRASGGPGGP